MKSYLSEILMALAAICTLLLISPYFSSNLTSDYSLLDSITSNFKEVPKYFVFSSFTPAIIIVMIFGMLIARMLGLLSSRKYTHYCYAISALTIIFLVVGFIRYGGFYPIYPALPFMLLGSYFAGAQSGKDE